MLETYEILVIGLMASFILLIFTGYPIAWVLAGVSFWFVVLALWGAEAMEWDTFMLDRWIRFGVIVDRIWSQMQNNVLVALPNFIFMGLMLEKSGVAERLMQAFTRLFGSLQGGLALAVCAIGILLAASTGIVGASVVRGLGFDPVWFVVVFAVMLQTSFLTPPVGFSLFYLKGVAPPQVSTKDIYLGVVPFVAVQLLVVFIIFEFPDLVLWLPREVYGR